MFFVVPIGFGLACILYLLGRYGWRGLVGVFFLAMGSWTAVFGWIGVVGIGPDRGDPDYPSGKYPLDYLIPFAVVAILFYFIAGAAFAWAGSRRFPPKVGDRYWKRMSYRATLR